MSEEIVTAADLAAERGWTRQYAWLWLSERRREFGPTVVQRERRGKRRLFVTAAGLQTILDAEKGTTDPKVLRELDALRTAVADLTTRVDAQAGELIEFRRQAHAWFTRSR